MVVVVGGGDGRGRAAAAAAACTDDAWPRSQLSVVVVAVSDDSARWLKNTLWREGDRGTPRRRERERERDRLLLQSGR